MEEMNVGRDLEDDLSGYLGAECEHEKIGFASNLAEPLRREIG